MDCQFGFCCRNLRQVVCGWLCCVLFVPGDTSGFWLLTAVLARFVKPFRQPCGHVILLLKNQKAIRRLGNAFLKSYKN